MKPLSERLNDRLEQERRPTWNDGEPSGLSASRTHTPASDPEKASPILEQRSGWVRTLCCAKPRLKIFVKPHGKATEKYSPGQFSSLVSEAVVSKLYTKQTLEYCKKLADFTDEPWQER